MFAMMKNLLLLVSLWLLFVSFQGVTKKKTFLVVRPLTGEGALALLRRYHLAGNTCGVKKFYEMNKFGKDKALLKGVDYQLPVYITTFNGSSIRSSIGITDVDRARRIQAYNELLHKQGVRKKSMHESGILWVPYHELACPESVPSAAPGLEEPNMKPPLAIGPVAGGAVVSGSYPIFGNTNSRVKRVSTKLKGKIFYVESGHGGPDPGAIGKSGKRSLCEDEYAYDVGLRVARVLISQGATVYIVNRDPNDGIRDAAILTCDCDERTYPNQVVPINQKKRLFQRSDIINTLYETNKKKGIKYQRYITIHVESRGKNERVDAFFYYKQGSKVGRSIADNMQKTFKTRYTYRSYAGSIGSRDLHMLRETKPDAVFVELGNIRNTFDQQRITKHTNRQALANWLVEGLTK